jgi:hypothetical protein
MGLAGILMIVGTPAHAAQQHDDHDISIPVSIGPLALRVILLAAVPAVAGFAILRAFLPEPGRTTIRWVAVLAAITVLLECMLADRLDIPARAAVALLAASAVPVYLAVAKDRRADRVTRHARRIAPWVLSLAGGYALVEFARGWLGPSSPTAALLHTGLILALTGLAWLTIGLPRSRAARVVIHVEAAVLAVAAVAAAGHATVLRPDSPAPRAAAAYHVEAPPVNGRELTMTAAHEKSAAPRSVMEEMTSLMLAVPSLAAPPGEVAAWYERKANLLEFIAADGGMDAPFAHKLAAAAHQHAARLLRNAA